MKYLLFLLLLSASIVSCVPHKKYLYFREGKENAKVQTYPLDTSAVYKIQSGDILNITISSTVASKTELLNQKFKENEGGPSNAAEDNGYLVDKDGDIELPLVGKIHVANLTVDQINETVKTKLGEYLDFIFVKTSLVNFKITVLGEVKVPGTKVIKDERVNIFQALGLAGDISDLGNRKNVRILRKVNNENQVITVDVSKTDIIGSNYYYLYPNDVVYVEPLRAKSLRFNLTVLSVGASLVTLLVVISNYISK